jgi:hypothetical protein
MNRDKAILEQIIKNKKENYSNIMTQLNQVNNPYLRETLFGIADRELSEIKSLESMYETMLYEPDYVESNEWHKPCQDENLGRYVFFRGF